jgi:hypothetical protein
MKNSAINNRIVSFFVRMAVVLQFVTLIGVKKALQEKQAELQRQKAP